MCWTGTPKVKSHDEEEGQKKAKRFSSKKRVHTFRCDGMLFDNLTIRSLPAEIVIW